MRIQFGPKSQLFAICVFLIASCNGGAHPNNANKEGAALEASGTVRKISPHADQQLVDTLNVQDPQGNYEPGDSSIVHAHLDLLFIY